MPHGWYSIMIIFLMLSETHKDGYDEFKKGCFGIKRTKKDFSRYRIDLGNICLEPICCKPKDWNFIFYKFKLICYFRLISYFVRIEILKKMFSRQDLKPNRIMKNTRDLQKSTGNSSKQETAELLLNRMLIRLVKKHVKVSLFNVFRTQKHLEECIPCHKILNFANEGALYSVREANNELMAVKMVPGLFESILFLALQRKIDMAEVISTYTYTTTIA